MKKLFKLICIIRKHHSISEIDEDLLFKYGNLDILCNICNTILLAKVDPKYKNLYSLTE